MVDKLKQYNNEIVTIISPCIINGSNNIFNTKSDFAYIVINGNNNTLYVS